MWTCPNCNRPFQTTNQWHICGEKTIDDIFEGKTDNVLLAFDDVLLATARPSFFPTNGPGSSSAQ